MSELTNDIELNIGGKVRPLKMTIEAIAEAEKLISTGNLRNLMMITDWNITDIVTVTYCGLRGGADDKEKPHITYTKVQQWVGDYVKSIDNGIKDLNYRLFSMVGLSGWVGGKESAYRDILAAMDGEEEETKN